MARRSRGSRRVIGLAAHRTHPRHHRPPPSIHRHLDPTDTATATTRIGPGVGRHPTNTGAAQPRTPRERSAAIGARSSTRAAARSTPNRSATTSGINGRSHDRPGPTTPTSPTPRSAGGATTGGTYGSEPGVTPSSPGPDGGFAASTLEEPPPHLGMFHPDTRYPHHLTCAPTTGAHHLNTPPPGRGSAPRVTTTAPKALSVTMCSPIRTPTGTVPAG